MLLSNRIDVTKLTRAIAALNADCTHVKKVLRTRWTRPMAAEQQRLVRLRREVTELFILLAASRNRLHVTVRPRDLRVPDSAWDAAGYNVTIAERRLSEFALTAIAQEAS